MKKPAKQPDSPKVSKLRESSAPISDLPTALNNVGNGSPEKITIDQSPRKPRLMNTLLDRLKERPNTQPLLETAPVAGQPNALVDFGQEDDFEIVTDFGRGSRDLNQPSSFHRPDHDAVWLGETQAGDSTTRSMTFTYSPGSTPLPPYTIRRGVGMGGFGEVYFALSDAGKEVALKRIQRNLEIELRGVSQCLNLKHPNLVALFDICRDSKDESWVVMEYVPGLNLRQILDEAPKGLSQPVADHWIRGIGAGVHHLHSAGLVHRDLKPGNIFDDLGQVKVGDYGLSKFISTSHRGGHTESVGTFHYMAPEIGRGEYGREIDIYALGILLFELLTGDVPFDGESCHEIIVKHLTATPDLSGIAEPYRSTIARCLEKDPNKRFASVADMLSALDGDVTEARSFQSPEATNSPVQSDVSAPLESLQSEPIEAILVAHSVEPSLPDQSGENNTQQDLFEEPVARAVQASWHDLSLWWTGTSQMSGPYAKMIQAEQKQLALLLLLILVAIATVNGAWLFTVLSVIACGYVPYYVIWKMVLQSRRQPKYAEAQRMAVEYTPQRQVVSPIAWSQSVRNELRAKPRLSRIAELNTSWIAAMLSIAGLSLTAAAIGLSNSPLYARSIALYAWIAVIVLGATFAILALGKLWECDEGEPLTRRLVLAGVGAGVGFLAYVTGEFLMIPFDDTLVRDLNSTSLSPHLYSAASHGGELTHSPLLNANPTVSAFMANFALLFALLRWWKPVDPLRRKRLSLWSIAVAVAVGWGVHQLIPITGAIGMISAGGIAIAVQLSAPWVNRRAMQARNPQREPVEGVAVNSSRGGSFNA